MTTPSRHIQASLRARFAALALDQQLAAGCESEREPALRRRAAILSSDRGRRRLAAGLRRVLTEDPHHPHLSAAVAVDEAAVEIARPALEQLERTLRHRADLRPQGLARTQLLLTDPESALYRAEAPETLYEVARAALLAMSSDTATRPMAKPQPAASLVRVG